MKLTHAIAFAAALTAAVSYAQEDEEEEVQETSAESVAEPKTKADGGEENVKWFFTLPACRRIQGEASVRKPGASAWEPAEEGRFYPLGSVFRAGSNSELVIAFGKEASVTVAEESSFATRSQPLSVKSRTIVLTGGEILVQLPGALASDLFYVTTPGLTVKNPAGDSRYTYKDTGDGFDATVRCVTGSLEVEGRHYEIPSMHAADEFRIRASHDGLETVLYGKSGDYVAVLDCGVITRSLAQLDGSFKNVDESTKLEWHLSVGTRVQINRAVPEIGERMSVVMMTFNPAGQMMNHCAYAEGRGEVNSGELVAAQDDTEAKLKKAADATTEGDADIEEDSAEEDSSSSDDSSDDDSSSDDDDDL